MSDWQAIALPPNVTSGAFSADTMLLMTDGTVVVGAGVRRPPDRRTDQPRRRAGRLPGRAFRCHRGLQTVRPRHHRCFQPVEPGDQPTVNSADSRITYTYNGATEPEDITFHGPQQVLFPVQVSFTDDNLFKHPHPVPPRTADRLRHRLGYLSLAYRRVAPPLSSRRGWPHRRPRGHGGRGGDGHGEGGGPSRLRAGHDRGGITGKVDAFIYDHFGEFAGFVLEDFHGRMHNFHSQEHRVEERVLRAGRGEVLLQVIVR